MIKKQRKDNSENSAPDEKETAKAAKVEHWANPDETPLTPELEIEDGKKGGEVEDDGKEPIKEPSEADVFKFYLKQSLDEVKKQKEEIESLKTQLGILETGLKQSGEKTDSIIAEYENYRRRTTAEKENLGSEATAKAVMALLTSLDNLERAVPFADSNPDSFKKGVEMTLRQLSETFKSLGVEEIEAQDAVFDPELHDAVMHVDDENVGESIITEVFQKGYRLGDRVIRHSVVKVANLCFLRNFIANPKN